MVVDNSGQPIQDEAIRDLLETFMDASAEESLRMLGKQGHILLSDPALQQVRDQITELSEIIETLKEKLQLLEETKHRHAATQRPYSEQALLQTLNVEDLFQALNVTQDRNFSMPDKTEIAKLMMNMPPELFSLFIQQILRSSPQQREALVEMLQKARNLSEEQKKSMRDVLVLSPSRLAGIDPHLLDCFLKVIWELPSEERRRFWLGETELLDLTKLQLCVEQYNIDLAALDEQAQQIQHPSTISTNALAGESMPPRAEKQEHDQLVQASFPTDTLTQVSPPATEEPSPQIVERNALFSTLLSRVGTNSYQASGDAGPPGLDNRDTCKAQ